MWRSMSPRASRALGPAHPAARATAARAPLRRAEMGRGSPDPATESAAAASGLDSRASRLGLEVQGGGPSRQRAANADTPGDSSVSSGGGGARSGAADGGGPRAGSWDSGAVVMAAEAAEADTGAVTEAVSVSARSAVEVEGSTSGGSGRIAP